MRAQTGSSAGARAGRAAGAGLLAAGIIALAFNLRAAITSPPPLFPELSATLGLSSATLALLATVPVLCFGVFSGFAAPLSRAFGEERVLGWSLVLLVAGLLMRGISPVALLIPGTALACGAIALMNVLLPSLIKRRRPAQAGLLIGMYLGSLCGGAIIGALIAVPVFNAAGGADWAARLSLGLWAVPALLAVAAWLPQMRLRTLPEPERESGPPPHPEPEPQRDAPAVPQPPTGVAGPRAGGAPPGAPAAGAPGARSAHGVLAMIRYRLAWQVTVFMGVQSLFYYACLSWLPTLFRDRGVSAAGAGGLLALMNLGNAVTALVIPVLAHRARDQRVLVVAALVADAVGLAGSAFGPLGGAPAFMLILGLGQGATLGLGIFITMARAPDAVTAASLSAFAQGAGYLLASLGPIGVGLLHTVTGSWTVPMLALLATVPVQLVSGLLAGRDLTIPARR